MLIRWKKKKVEEESIEDAPKLYAHHEHTEWRRTVKYPCGKEGGNYFSWCCKCKTEWLGSVVRGKCRVPDA